MRELLRRCFEEKKIEYYAVLDYADCIETGGGIAARDGLSPRSVILYLVPYYAGETENLSRYAASLDYHIVLREIGEGLIERLKERRPDAMAHSYGDHSPIDECHAALVSGLGVRGDNGLLINERYGSYVFIGDVVCDIPPEELGAVRPTPVSGCLHCGACKRACPTGILRGDGADCLSAITQRKGELGDGETAMMRKYNTAWGCDLCQSCCPYNSSPTPTPISSFYEERMPRLERAAVEAMSKAEFSRRAFAWRGRRTVLRNLAVLENDGSEEAVR